MDLGWSEAVESQAFDRVHRLGQERPVFVNRLVIQNTVEDRVLAMQERKVCESKTLNDLMLTFFRKTLLTVVWERAMERRLAVSRNICTASYLIASFDRP